MNKKIILFAAGAVLLAASAFTFASVNKSNDPMSDLFKANVEALADTEAGGGRAVCYSQYSLNDSMRCLECGTCNYVNGAGVDKGGYCKW